ncbi:MAG TPA: aminotransferase class I/II-fold pyridoxal phosphate-dependent enzyme [Nitrosomonas europaea]|uniref:serine palmitoyltransferase n=1 Tax=Nitrosomonas europaea TaxID=915 RepID=UPI002492AA74|nr:aminotransferase class I/II-fold pyridoxal phosphate-dependent enzyme [Nitrosomonas europaea]HRN80869.1 aminotransferase class I/II-fold pyridoxal phosphate-dependent enzyme [Nitrosomonas europaea]HRO55191.1 aminotransferase class I/II-fold pyridoxal phosphate-dependent enzyme [Nitrosomonas europaea]HRQ07555.1 aminotransferase class I/II-fold pyridoxal phosphate-dependent enzyme [Nitrosomonas europaea]HUM72787.1 aminotransferase class I/II-fold pyridoxal phosphate-dependent enzyme [Nitrosomo
MSLLEKLDAAAAARKAQLPEGIGAFGIPIEESYSATEARIGKRRVLMLGTNNYLGLSFAPECREAAHQAIDQEGTGTTGSRMANGNYYGHRALEREFAEFYKYRECIVFTTGYQANLGTISGLVGAGDIVLIDGDAHASIYDGCILSGADIIRFRHNDPADLEKRLRRLGDRSRNTLIIIEGIYSMLGDQAPLAEIVQIKNTYQSTLLLDEAHSLGVLGETGQGLVEKTGMNDEIDFITGTFSKSLCGIGGFCVSNHPQLDQLRYVSHPYIFTASPSPATIASTRAALKLLQEGRLLRKCLWQNAHRLYSSLEKSGYRLGPQPGPIVAILLDNPRQALTLWNGLMEHDIYVNLVLPPAAPEGKSLVRCSINAAHTTEQIDQVCDVFSKLHPIVA